MKKCPLVRYFVFCRFLFRVLQSESSIVEEHQFSSLQNHLYFSIIRSFLEAKILILNRGSVSVIGGCRFIHIIQ